MNFEPTHVRGIPACCYACGHSAIGMGVGKATRGADPRYLCDECKAFARAIGGANLDAFETRALIDAGKHAGGYLDDLGATDLVELEPEQWRLFCRTMIQGFAASIRRQAQERFTK